MLLTAKSSHLYGTTFTKNVVSSTCCGNIVSHQFRMFLLLIIFAADLLWCQSWKSWHILENDPHSASKEIRAASLTQQLSVHETTKKHCSPVRLFYWGCKICLCSLLTLCTKCTLFGVAHTCLKHCKLHLEFPNLVHTVDN